MNCFEQNKAAFFARYPNCGAELAEPESIAVRPPASLSTQTIEEMEGASLLLCLSLGADSELEQTYYRFGGRRPYFVIVDQSWENLCQAFQRSDWRPLIEDDKVDWMIGLQASEAQLHFYNYFGSESHSLASHTMLRMTNYQADDANYYQEIERSFNSIAQKRVQYGVAPTEDSYQGLLNVRANLETLASLPLLDQLKDCFAGIPGVVISSGPSLEHSFELLRQHQEQAVYFCADSALKVLQEEGIQPHFVGCFERVPNTTRTISKVTPSSNTWLVGLPLIMPESFTAYTGPQCTLIDKNAHMSWFYPHQAHHDLGRSVAHMAYQGLTMLGCDPILLVGQDLAFDPFENRSHVTGAPNHISQRGADDCARLRSAENSADDWVSANNGKKILSRWDLIKHLALFDPIIRASGRNCINAIPEDYGASVVAATRMDPVDAFAKLREQSNSQKTDIRQIIKKQLSSPTVAAPDRMIQFKGRQEEALDYFENSLVPKTLEQLHRISVFLQQHLPTSKYYNPKLEAECQRFFVHIEEWERHLIGDKNGPYQLLAPFIWTIKVQTQFKLAEFQKEPEPFTEKIIPIFETLQAYYREILAWGMRLNALFAALRQ